MARTKQTARRSTAGKAPRRAVFGGWGANIFQQQQSGSGSGSENETGNDSLGVAPKKKRLIKKKSTLKTINIATVSAESTAKHIQQQVLAAKANKGKAAMAKKFTKSKLSKQDTLPIADKASTSRAMSKGQSSASRQTSSTGKRSMSTTSSTSKKGSVPKQVSKRSMSKQASKISVTKQASRASLAKGASKTSLSKQTSKASMTKQASKASMTKKASKASMSKQSSKGSMAKQSSKASLTKLTSNASMKKVASKSKMATKPSVKRLSSKASLTKSASKGSYCKHKGDSVCKNQIVKTLSKKLSKGASIKASSSAKPKPKKERKRKTDDSADESPKRKRKTSPKKGKKDKEEKEETNPIFFKNGDYVAIRNEEDGFYLCRLCQNVREQTKFFKAYWMDLVADSTDSYQFEYVEFVQNDYTCIISKIYMKKTGRKVYELRAAQKLKIEQKLKKVLDSEKGLAVSDSEEEDEEEVEETPKKKKVPTATLS